MKEGRKYLGGNVHKGDSAYFRVPAKSTKEAPPPSVCDLWVISLGSPCSENLYPQNQEEAELGEFPSRGGWVADDQRTGWDKFPGGGFPFLLWPTNVSSAKKLGAPWPGIIAGIFLCLSASCVWNEGIRGFLWPLLSGILSSRGVHEYVKTARKEGESWLLSRHSSAVEIPRDMIVYRKGNRAILSCQGKRKALLIFWNAVLKGHTRGQSASRNLVQTQMLAVRLSTC